jgi:hypothetical protein
MQSDQPRDQEVIRVGCGPWTTDMMICHHFGMIIGKDDITFIW